MAKSQLFSLLHPSKLVLILQAHYKSGQAELPEQAWPVDQPENHGLKRTKLQQASQKLAEIPGRQGWLVVKNGQLIYEDYFVGNAYSRIFVNSLTKSVGASLIGVALKQGLISLETRIADCVQTLPAGLNPEATVHHVLSQVSESDPVGSAFSYNSGDVINSLSEVLQAALRKRREPDDVLLYAHRALLRPLGMSNSSWMRWGQGNITMGYGLRSNHRDIARIGQLYLNGGRWGDKQLLSPEFVQAAWKAPYPDVNPAHGYLWWLNHDVPHWTRLVLKGTGQLISGAPEDLVMATGLLGNFMFVFPSEQLIVVSLGRTFNRQIESLITAREIYPMIAEALLN